MLPEHGRAAPWHLRVLEQSGEVGGYTTGVVEGAEYLQTLNIFVVISAPSQFIWLSKYI